MMEPTDPVGPAFETARNEDAEKRAQRIVALTPDQRQDYERRVRDEQTKQNDHRRELEKNWSRNVEDEKKRIKEDKNRLELTPPIAKGMSDAKAEELARGRVNERASASMEQAEKDSQGRLDDYLKQVERDRTRQAKTKTDERDQPGKSAGQDAQRDSNDKARDPALKRAFERANERQDGQEVQQNRTRETATTGERSADQGKNDALKRAFDTAARQKEQQQQQAASLTQDFNKSR